MLRELRVENLLLIERAELVLADGLNVLTGETGAGKTVLAQALDLLMGARAHPGTSAGRPRATSIVRPGAETAYVEGVFAVPEALRAEIRDLLPEAARDEGECDELVLARRVGADGRTRAFVSSRAAGAADLRELGSRLISFYGQHEHRKLVLASAQLQMLDAVCGERHAARLRECAARWRRTRELQTELQRLGELAAARERELGLLEHELAEIDDAAPDLAKHADLTARRDRLRGVEALRLAAGAALEALVPEAGEGAGAAHMLAGAVRALHGAAGVDAELDALAERAGSLCAEADDLAGSLRSYCATLEGEGESLQQLEERLAAVERLARKHGGSVAAVLDYAESASERAQELSGAEQAQERVREQLTGELERLDGIMAKLRAARERAAVALAEAVREQLAALAMPDATFAIELTPTEPRADGADAVEFTIAPNPGVPAAPLREIASGGELSRAMLALASACEGLRERTGTAGAPARPHTDDGATAAAAAGEIGSTLVFDEVDAGIGGHTARAVGERLQTLARGRQLICITHLPQIASLADRHFTVRKDTAAEITLATVTRLTEREVEGELVRMLGAQESDTGARRHARELRRAA